MTRRPRSAGISTCVGFIMFVVPLTGFAETPSERVRALYQEVPFESVRASPSTDIQTHIEEMVRRRNAPETSLVVPDLNLEMILQQTNPADILMDPRVLEAISRMPPDRAATVLRMIEDRRSGLNPLADVPSLSLRDGSAPMEEPEGLGLRGWSLDRDPNGAPFIQLGADSASRILILPGMILGDMGRVVSLQDDPDGFRLILESGDMLEGDLLPAAALSEDPMPRGLVGESRSDLIPQAGPAVADEVAVDEVAVVHPPDRGPEIAPPPDPVPVVRGEEQTPVVVLAPAAGQVKPRMRPVGLGGSPQMREVTR